MDTNFSEATEFEANSLSKPRACQLRIAVLVALGLSVGLVAGFSLSSLKNSPQPPVDLINVENTQGLREARPDDGAGANTHWRDFYKTCRSPWTGKPGFYSFAEGWMPHQNSWSYAREENCHESAIKACEADKDCAGLAGHQDVYGRNSDGKPKCWGRQAQRE